MNAVAPSLVIVLDERAQQAREDIAYFEGLDAQKVDADREGLTDTLNFLREKLRRLESAASVLRWGRP